jgi:hypothetical protein
MTSFRNNVMISVVSSLKQLERLNDRQKCYDLLIESASPDEFKVVFDYSLFRGNEEHRINAHIYVNENDFSFIAKMDIVLSASSVASYGTAGLEKHLSRNTELGEYLIKDNIKIFYLVTFTPRFESLEIKEMCRTLFAFIDCSSALYDTM